MAILFANSSHVGDAAEVYYYQPNRYIQYPRKAVHSRTIHSEPDTTSSSGTLGGSCKSDDRDHLCLALKYGVYKDYSGRSVITPSEAIENVKQIDRVWHQCNIAFQIDEFVSVDPNVDELNYQPANTGELDVIRKRLDDSDKLLVVTTGTWNRSGSLGSSGANAWTAMPGENLYGAILESPVGKFGNIIAHELGHYLSLAHVGDASDLMNPIIYENSTQLASWQCTNARAAVQSYWQRMVRS